MKSTYGSVAELAAELTRQDGLKNDYTPISTQISMNDAGNKIGLEGVGSFSVTPLMHRQLADRLKIPRQYYDRIESVPGLRATNVNELLQATPERRMVRTMGDSARAFLSDRYRPIDNLFVLTPFMEALMDHRNKGGEFQIKANTLSDSRMYVQVIFPNISGEVVKNGDVVSAGVNLVNSEVGLGAFDVRSLVWRQWCENGAVAESFIRKYHTGRRIGNNDEDYNIYSDETMRKEMDAFRSRLGDIFRNVITDESFQAVLENLRAAAGDKIVKPNTVIENVTKRYNLSADNGESILSNMVEEGNLNRYGLFNGITALAKTVDDADKAFEFEKLGSDIISLKKSEWNILNESVA